MPPSNDSPKAQLGERGLVPKKHFGQNFLADARLAARIAELATTPPGGTVVELGAGLGALTRPLLERAARVVAVERDRDLIPLLSAAIADPRLSVVEADAKSVDVVQLIGDGPRPHVLAGNLPYQITGPLLEKSVGLASRLDRAVFLVQLEVADRVAAQPGTSAYGALAVFVQAAFKSKRAFIVKRGAFYPQPGVDSAVIVLEPHPTPLAVEDDAFRAVVRAAFGQRRKKLRNAWRGVLGATDEALAAAATRAGVDLEARGETVDVAGFARMARELAG